MHTNRFIRFTTAIPLALATAIAAPAFGEEISHGEVAAAIRSADYPCAHVISLENAGENAWSVTCNSGLFRVSRDADGGLTVTKTE